MDIPIVLKISPRLFDIPENLRIKNRVELTVNIQGVTGGKDRTSGGCSLC